MKTIIFGKILQGHWCFWIQPMHTTAVSNDGVSRRDWLWWSLYFWANI